MSSRRTTRDSQTTALRATVNETDDTIAVHIGKKPVLVYNKTKTRVPEGIEEIFSRNGFIHPIYSPSGRVVTGHYPKDHPHQNGLFCAWVDTSFRGHHVDFWNRKKAEGRVSHHRVNFVRNSDDRAEFSVELAHEDVTDPKSPVAVLYETWHVTVHPSVDPGFMIDVVSTQRCATSDPLIINEYRYGGMAIRGCDQWFSESSGSAAKKYTKAVAKNPDAVPPSIDEMAHDFLTSESKGRFDGNHSRPNWVDLFGSVDGKMAGIAIFDNRQNLRSPQPVRLNPSKPYFCFAPNVIGTFKITPNESLVSKYRLLIHDGPPDPESLDRHWSQFNSE